MTTHTASSGEDGYESDGRPCIVELEEDEQAAQETSKSDAQESKLLLERNEQVEASIYIGTRRRRAYKGRIFAVKKKHQHKAPAKSQKAAGRIFDYEQKYDEDAYGEETSPEARLWKTYGDECELFDMERIEAWRDALDVLLVFLGLFSAIVTTFVIETSGALQPDYAQITATITYEILRAIANSTSSTAIDINVEDPRAGVASPTSVDIWVNGLWFTSLAVSLSAGLITVLTKQWLYHYVANTSGTSQERARIRQFRFAGLERYRVPMIIDLLPIALHLALALFLVGLGLFLSPLHNVITGVVSAVAGITYILYVVSVFLPLNDPQCPYQSPISFYIYPIKRPIIILYHYFAHIIPRVSQLSNAQRAISQLVFVPMRDWFVVKQKAFLRMLEGAFTLRRRHPNPHIPSSLSGSEKKAVWLERSQLDADSIVWLYKTSSNTTVQSIALQAIGGLPPSNADTRVLCTIVADDLEFALRNLWDFNGELHPQPFPETARQFDRLIRSLCIGQGNLTSPWLESYSIKLGWPKSFDIEDPMDVFYKAILPFILRPHIEVSAITRSKYRGVLAEFLPPGPYSDVRFPLSVWSAYIHCLFLFEGDNPIVIARLLDLGALNWTQQWEVDDSIGPTTIATALKSNSILRARVIEVVLGFASRTGGSLQETIEHQGFSPYDAPLLSRICLLEGMVTQASQKEDDVLISSSVKALTRTFEPGQPVPRECLPHLQNVLHQVFKREPYALQWSTLATTLSGLSYLTLPPHLLVDLLPQSTLVLAFRQCFRSIEEDEGGSVEWAQMFMKVMNVLLYQAFKPITKQLAHAITLAIQEVDMLPLDPDPLEQTVLKLFWSQALCGTLIEGTLLLRGVDEKWMDYIHTPHRLLFLTKQLLFDDRLAALARIQPGNGNWVGCLQDLLHMLNNDDLSGIDFPPPENELTLVAPRRRLSDALQMLIKMLRVHHPVLSGTAFHVPMYDYYDHVVSHEELHIEPPPGPSQEFSRDEVEMPSEDVTYLT